MRSGETTTVYIQNWMEEAIQQVIERFPDKFKSRSSFIDAAIAGKLRDLGIKIPGG